MNVVGKVGSLISQGVYSVSTPFHPFGGAVDIIVVQQQDGSFRSTPWYVRFGKFQGVLKGAEKIVDISVNGTDANFHMHLDNSGEAYFVREVDPENESRNTTGSTVKESDAPELGSSFINCEEKSKNMVGYKLEHSVSDTGPTLSLDEFDSSGMSRIDRSESDLDRRFYDFSDDEPSHEDSVDPGDQIIESSSNSEVVLVSVDGHILMAPFSVSEENNENVQLSTPFHLGPGEEAEFCEENGGFNSGGNNLDGPGNYIRELNAPTSVDVMSATRNDANASSENHLEICEGDGEHKCCKDVISQTGKAPLQSDSEDASMSIKQKQVFMSCLDLPELGKQSDGLVNSESINSTSGILAPAPRERFAESFPAVDKAIHALNCSGIGSINEIPPSHSLVKTTNVQTDTVEPIHENLISTENMNTSSVSKCPGGDKESEDGHASTAVEIESTEETREEMYPKVKHDMIETGEGPEVTDVRQAINYLSTKIEISLCRNELHSGMGSAAAAEVFDARRITAEEYKSSMASIVKDENLVIRYHGKYMSWEEAEALVLGLAAFGSNFPFDSKGKIPVEEEETLKVDIQPGDGPSSSRRWRLWPIPFRRVKTIEHQNSSLSDEDVFLDSEPFIVSLQEPTPTSNQGDKSPRIRKLLIRTNVPTSDQVASLNLKDGQNLVTFSFSTRVLGKQQVDAHIYLWKWNARIVISDVDGTITKSDVLGQFMPLVGKDWTQSGVARLFSAIKENGYQLLFLSARAIVQAYLTRSFLLNLKQDGKALPNGPIVISPDGLFPSLYREVIRRTPHEFKIACLEDIKALFPSDYNPFYAGFGNRDTDELSYSKIGIPKGKIFIINPKGEVAISHCIDSKSYTSLHTLVNDMFPPTSLVEQEEYNSWNFWKMPPLDIEC
ncbi:hypothetical protein SAY86_025037 [Trapa natans]|uniref:phosphatidate phosphatase n=1 Tax=Trapa natans TaxID=22666 RepID=A0AAN7MIA0_TRANT|nr:hypothetical protein SAY86_025037 [Trapa natans]